MDFIRDKFCLVIGYSEAITGGIPPLSGRIGENRQLSNLVFTEYTLLKCNGLVGSADYATK